MINCRVGQMVKYYREIAKMEQSELAEKVGVSQPVISKLEGGSASWTISRLLKVCVVLKVSISDLIVVSLSISSQ
jgi:transcriptional regulator with XRE-family HTH domain